MGPKGYKGAKGFQGSIGLAGTKGEKVTHNPCEVAPVLFTSLKGDIGLIGVPGHTGPQGPQVSYCRSYYL